MWVPGTCQKAPATGPPQHMANVCWQPCALVPPSASSVVSCSARDPPRFSLLVKGLHKHHLLGIKST